MNFVHPLGYASITDNGVSVSAFKGKDAELSRLLLNTMVEVAFQYEHVFRQSNDVAASHKVLTEFYPSMASMTEYAQAAKDWLASDMAKESPTVNDMVSLLRYIPAEPLLYLTGSIWREATDEELEAAKNGGFVEPPTREDEEDVR